jgi:hypothetical protein
MAYWMDSMETKYQIVALPNFYEPDIQGNNRPYVVCEDDGQTERVFDSIDDARHAIDDLESDIYVTANGESGRPDYYVTEWGVETQYEDQSWYDWENNDCDGGIDGSCCGECQQCIEMMIDRDRARVIGNAK